ncbi:YceI family protein [uncultured Bdellovibrio sp.]|uniref:YceI family protein n=1 Tax=Bdellovibrio sp. HCB-162 TaxID=3394234 RepID=UPI0025E124EA|nr:YceI family protein [uncultured Bdellovibrio sp.]
MKYVLFVLFFMCSPGFAATSFKMTKESGTTNFLAIGNPSAIRIDGKGEGPEGTLVAQEKGENWIVSGDLRVNLKNTDTGIALRDRHMKEKYLEVGKFENAVLTVNDLTVPKNTMTKETDTKLPFAGTLDLHGIKKPVQGEFVVKSSKEGVKMTANFQLKLSDFGIVIPSFAGITVADQVEVNTTSTVERLQ